METDEEPPDCPVGEGADILNVVSGAPLALDEIIEESLLHRDQPGTVGEVILPHSVHQTILFEALHLNLPQPLPEDPGYQVVLSDNDVLAVPEHLEAGLGQGRPHTGPGHVEEAGAEVWQGVRLQLVLSQQSWKIFLDLVLSVKKKKNTNVFQTRLA